MLFWVRLCGNFARVDSVRGRKGWATAVWMRTRDPPPPPTSKHMRLCSLVGSGPVRPLGKGATAAGLVREAGYFTI